MSKFQKGIRALSTAATQSIPQPQQAIPLAPLPKEPSRFQHSKCFAKCTDLTVVKGEGCYVTDAQGRTYLDATSGIAVTSTGHCHPKIVEAVQKQAATLLHGQLNCYASHPQLDELLDNLGRTMPGDIDRFIVDTTGTQAIEAAVKLARRHTGRQNIICLSGGFHGRSVLTTAMTTSNTGPRYPKATPLPGGVYHVEPPLAFRWGVSEEEAVERAWQGFKDCFQSKVPVDQVAAVLFEPVLGEGGFVPVAPAFANRVAEFCKENGILMVSDEVQAGAGRTGNMWGCQAFDYTPDILVSAKGVASGMPLSVVCTTAEIDACYTPGTHGGTYMGNALACAAANATLKVIEEENLLENVQTLGSMLKGTLEELRTHYLPQSDVRGTGYMIGMECVDEEGAPSPQMAQAIKAHCQNTSGVLLYNPSGWYGNCLRFMPPLVAREEEILHLSSAVEQAMKAWKESC
eukprot:Rhum_TRINITY_DN16427_c0_g1::Rhum_TRINITY_DN16427_c0_g1_i1::g.163235::m.163235/K00823/puuE; 4-aminobutyrate aminotransferase